MAVDPGETTGVAAGLFDLRLQRVGACMRRARSKGNLTSWEVLGNHVDQAWEISRWFNDWHFSVHVERQLVMSGHTYFVLEDFIPRQLHYDTTPMFVIGGIETLLVPNAGIAGYDGDRVQPSEKWSNDQWLKDNRLWVPSLHERDARRHLAGKLDSLLG